MSATFQATIDGNVLSVEVRESAPPKFRIVVSGKDEDGDGDEVCELDAVRLPSGSWSVLWNSRSLVVDIRRTPANAVEVIVSGNKHLVELVDARTARFASMVNHAGGAKAKGEIIRAPIAGKVVKLSVAVGDQVSAGDSIIVLEAMKMENDLASTRAGTVEKIAVAAGDSVDTGQTLVTIV